ncbi:M48 family metalloprotease [Vibrio vulnificus]|uniref:M48 family metalloprotease n=1 Tax=Vibrio vulnificus TaxID=672 RepID=UPI0032F00F06
MDEQQFDKGINIYALATAMFVSCLVVTMSLAFIAVLIFIISNSNFWGGPSAYEIGARVLGYGSIALLIPIVGLFWGAISTSSSSHIRFINHSKCKPLSSSMNEKIISKIRDRGIVDERLIESIKLYEYDSNEINAWALGGKNSAYIAFSSSCLSLDFEEVFAIFCHELGHIYTDDSNKLTFARSFQKAISLMFIIEPLKGLARRTFFVVSELILLKLSRSREYRADKFASYICGSSNMVSALETLENSGVGEKKAEFGELSVASKSKDSIWSTHPSIQNRISSLSKDEIIIQTTVT